MQIKKYKNLLFTFACLPLISLAQQNTISPYSAFGIGEVQSQGFALNSEMGGLGLALRPNSNLNPMNPASLRNDMFYHGPMHMAVAESTDSQMNATVSDTTTSNYIILIITMFCW